ncbi:MAG: SCO family protein [Woeseiaceae bacterium]|jgi:protein SCO1/2
MDPRKLFITVSALIAIGTGAWLSFQLFVPPPVPKTATVLPSPAELPEFILFDQAGRPFRRDDLAGDWNLVFFGFTQCPDICPLTLQVLSSARQQLIASGRAPAPRIVFVSVDPERDTPEIIDQYLGHFDPDAVGITGNDDELRNLTGGLGIFFQKSALSDENYSVDHSAVVLLIDPQARFHAVFSAPHAVENFVHDLPIVMTTP